MNNITGLGCISSIGEDVLSFATLENTVLPQPSLAFKQDALADTQFYQGELTDEMAGSAYKLALHACRSALADHRQKNNDFTSNIAVIIATGAGDTEQLERLVEANEIAYDIAERISCQLELTGVFVTVSNACSSAVYAMEMVSHLLASNHDAVLLCGVEAKSTTSQATFKALMVLDPQSCRPFSKDRKGTVLGCGAAALVLTNKRAVATSNAYATVLSTALNGDAHHPTSPEPSGFYMKQCMDNAIKSAEITPNDIDLFIPHATGTQLNDAIEQRLLAELSTQSYCQENTLLLKKYIGHTGGASAAFSYLIAALILKQSSGLMGQTKRNVALVNATAFGGNNSSSVLAAINHSSKQEETDGTC